MATTRVDKSRTGSSLSGEIRFQIERDSARKLHAGSAFHEPAGVTILHFDNTRAERPATFIAIYLLPANEDRLIEILANDQATERSHIDRPWCH